MEAHPLCRILPEMSDADYRRLVEDISTSGLLRPITLFEGMILDGRHRFKACSEVGIEPRFEQFAGKDPVAFVRSCCTHRTLNQTQRALIAAGFLAYEQELARLRQTALAGTRKTDLPEDLPEGLRGESRDKAGERMGVSGKTVTDAARVMVKAVPEIVDKLKNGGMTVNEAKRIINLNPAAQRRIAALPKKERDGEIKATQARSTAARIREIKAPQPEVIGTPFVRTMLSGIERLAMVCAEQGLRSGSDIATRFMQEMQWDALPLTIQLDRCEPIIRALSIILQERSSKAA